jgi:hypothetical protein
MRGLLDLISSGETLASEGITTEKPPPAFLQVQPTGARRDEEVMMKMSSLGLAASMSWRSVMELVEVREATQRVNSLPSRTRSAP